MSAKKKPGPEAEAKAESGEPKPEPETVRQRPQRPFCEACGAQMTATSSRPTKTHYKCKCGATCTVPRPSPVPATPPGCPYHDNVQCQRTTRDGRVIDRCREPGCLFRVDYGPTFVAPPEQEGFSAR